MYIFIYIYIYIYYFSPKVVSWLEIPFGHPPSGPEIGEPKSARLSLEISNNREVK